MGIYDTYGETQLKVGDPYCDTYKIGNPVLIPDGIYWGLEAIVVVYQGRFVAEISHHAVFDKWGGKIAFDIDERNPVSQAVKSLTDKEHP
jgi:hypothetical protein